jgi:hypothetical protein
MLEKGKAMTGSNVWVVEATGDYYQSSKTYTDSKEAADKYAEHLKRVYGDESIVYQLTPQTMETIDEWIQDELEDLARTTELRAVREEFLRVHKCEWGWFDGKFCCKHCEAELFKKNISCTATTTSLAVEFHPQATEDAARAYDQGFIDWDEDDDISTVYRFKHRGPGNVYYKEVPNE